MAGFWIVLMSLGLLGLVFWTAAGLLGALAFALWYGKKRRRWQRIAAIILGIIGGVCGLALLALAIWGRTLP